MDSQIKRGKLVNFRVSEEEFEQIAEATRASGARSVSMFARAAILAPQSAEVNVANIQNHLAEIDRKLDRLFESLALPVASGDGRDNLVAAATASGSMH